ncbi:MAG: hypothetical protein ACRED9_04400 [Caulobacteraceae bacterium]
MRAIFGRAVATTAVILGATHAARADPRLDERVYGPYVEQGVGEIEARQGDELGGPLGGAEATVIEAEYGFGRISLAAVEALSRAPSGPMAPASLGFEAKAYLGRIPGVGLDAGLYAEYGAGLNGAADSLEAKLLLAKRAGRFDARFNLIAERPLGVPAGQGYASWGWAASATWRVAGRLKVGGEAFGDLGSDRAFLGRKGAYAGPVVKWEFQPRRWPAKIGLEAGWLAAAGADRREGASQVRFGLEIERKFR